jgi:pimeloyl-ACP methyl ester carboxylesterase
MFLKILRWTALILGLLVVIAAILLYQGDLPAEVVDAKYSNESSQFLTLNNGTRVHYRDEGNRSGLPLVLIHGAMASLHTWEPWVEILGDTYRVISLDLPAHGLTGRVPDGIYGAQTFTSTINAVVDELDVERFVLGGNSMGGGATWRYTLAYPDRVIAMILVDSVPAGNWRSSVDEPSADEPSADEAPAAERREEPDDGPIFFKLMRQDWFRAIARYLDPGLLVEQGLRSAYNNSPVVDQALIDRYYELSLREGTRAAILQRAGSGGGSREAADLSVLTQPTLIMWGAQDALIPVSVVEQFEQSLPNTRTVIYDDLGHVPMEEDPLRSAADVRVFLEDLAVGE